MMLRAFANSPLFSAAAATANADDPATVTVVLTGLVLVFAILILLYFIVTIEGKIFQSLDKKKAAKEAAKSQAPAAPAAAQPAPVSVAPVASDEPAVAGRVPPDVVAAITAAVSAASGGQYTLRSVSTVKQGRGQWGLAGIIQNTEPF